MIEVRTDWEKYNWNEFPSITKAREEIRRKSLSDIPYICDLDRSFAESIVACYPNYIYATSTYYPEMLKDWYLWFWSCNPNDVKNKSEYTKNWREWYDYKVWYELPHLVEWYENYEIREVEIKDWVQWDHTYYRPLFVKIDTLKYIHMQERITKYKKFLLSQNISATLLSS